MSKTPKQMAAEYVAGEDYCGEEAAGAYSGFLAGYEAALDKVIEYFQLHSGKIADDIEFVFRGKSKSGE